MGTSSVTIETETANPRPATSAPTISVIVPAYNAAHYMERSLPPLIAMKERGDILELIVVDDCSTEPSNIDTAISFGATVLQMPKNGGPGAARNLAATKAEGDILWFVDADVIAHMSGPERIREAFQDRAVAAVFGSYDQHPPGRSFASGYKNLVHRYYHQHGNRDSSTFWSGCGAIRRDVFAEMGGFDCKVYERPSIEDIEFGFRMKAAGWSIHLIPTLLGTHLKEWTLWEVIRTDIFQRAIPWSQLIIEGRGPSDDLNVSQSERFKAVLAGVWLLSLLALLVPMTWPASLAIFAITSTAVIISNLELIKFFTRNKSIGFAFIATIYHQFYYLYSAITFTLCMVANILKKKPTALRESKTIRQE